MLLWIFDRTLVPIGDPPFGALYGPKSVHDIRASPGELAGCRKTGLAKSFSPHASFPEGS